MITAQEKIDQAKICDKTLGFPSASKFSDLFSVLEGGTRDQEAK